MSINTQKKNGSQSECSLKTHTIRGNKFEHLFCFVQSTQSVRTAFEQDTKILKKKKKTAATQGESFLSSAFLIFILTGLLKVLKKGACEPTKNKSLTLSQQQLFELTLFRMRTTKRHDRSGQMSPLLAGQETWVRNYERSGDCRSSSVLPSTRGMRQLEALARACHKQRCWPSTKAHGDMKYPLTAGGREDVMETVGAADCEPRWQGCWDLNRPLT